MTAVGERVDDISAYTPPILVACPSEVLVFETVADAEAYMEPIDVREGEYLAAYDSEGRKLGIGVGFEDRPGLFGWGACRAELVKLLPLDEQPGEAELASSLRNFLADVYGRGDAGRELVADAPWPSWSARQQTLRSCAADESIKRLSRPSVAR